MVAEEPNVASSDPSHIANSGAEASRKSGRHDVATERKSLGGASAFSGTTARTSRSGQDLEEMTSDDLQDALPDLNYAAEKLLDFLVSSPKFDAGINEAAVSSLRKELTSKNSQTRNKYKRLASAFNIQRQAFGTNSFINIEAILGALFGSKRTLDTTQEPWRPDSLLLKANVAAFAMMLLSPEDMSDYLHLWAIVDETFPSPFFDKQDSPSDKMLEGTIQAAIEIRTQYAIMLITQGLHQEDFNADRLLDDVFNQGDSIKGWNFASMQTRELSKASQKAMVKRLSSIRNVYQQAKQSSQSSEAVINAYREAFPWTRFLRTAMVWAKQRLVDIQHSVDGYGGSDRILESLNTEIERRRDLQPPPEGGDILDRPTTSDNTARQPPHPSREHAERPRTKPVAELRSESFRYPFPPSAVGTFERYDH